MLNKYKGMIIATLLFNLDINFAISVERFCIKGRNMTLQELLVISFLYNKDIQRKNIKSQNVQPDWIRINEFFAGIQKKRCEQRYNGPSVPTFDILLKAFEIQKNPRDSGTKKKEKTVRNALIFKHLTTSDRNKQEKMFSQKEMHILLSLVFFI